MSDNRHRVLIVEDDLQVAKTYEHWLSADYRVELAMGGREALDAVHDAIDVILLDRRMPGVSGDEVLERIHERDIDCYVAIVSAVDPGWEILKMGFDAYLTKPIKRQELRDLVQQLLSRSEFAAEIRSLYALQNKAAVLRESKSETELKQSLAYSQLQAAIEERKSSLDAERERLADDHEFISQIRDIEESISETEQ
ncbi:response regulator [Halogeometricum borinquense]|uniref:Response regulator n=1 Tax=Halogeometricum borinquense TaxID=60847 RepID=A0A482T6Z2_9EURY|nr:response regulator [Halogeometricum borinquense]RYJ08667.1 response regulator [Halogeometricum borinquense]